MKIAKFRPLSGFCGSWCLATFLISLVMSLVVLTDSLGAAETDAWFFIAVAVIALFANILFVVCSLCKWNQFVYIYNDAIVQKQWGKTIKIPYSEVTGLKLKFQSKTFPRIVIYSPTAKISFELSKKEVFFQNCPDNKLKENVKYLLKKHGIRHDFVPNYGSELLNKGYEKFFKGEHLSYEEFVIMLSTNDELYFMYNGSEYQVEHTSKDFVAMCVSRLENKSTDLDRYEKFDSIIELLNDFKIDGKSIYEIWPNVCFPKSK